MMPTSEGSMGWLTSALESFAKLFKWWVVVAPWEAGIRVRLGKRVKPLSPGIHFRIPFLDRVYVQSIRLRIVSQSNQTMATRDRKAVTVSLAVQFAIADLTQLYLTVAYPEDTLLYQVQGLVAEMIANSTADELTPKAIEQDVSEKIKALDWGLAQVRVFVTGFAFVKTYRLLMNDYRTAGGLNTEDERRAGGRT